MVNQPKIVAECPTLQYLNVDASSIDDVSPQEQAKKWLSAFEASVSSKDLSSFKSLFHQCGFWKDILALTWDLRTIHGHVLIRRMLAARLAATGLSTIRLLEDPIRGPKIIKPLPDLVFLRFCFEFETIHGKGDAVAFLVPTPNGTWTAWSLLTRLYALKAFPEKIGALRATLAEASPEGWEDRRQRETDFMDGDPTVLIVGAGHNGLAVAARLNCLGVPTLVVDKNKRVGDNWRTRYKTLRLHDTVWANRLPYLDFPPSWPVYFPAPKFGDWLECYATALDLNVWGSSSVVSATFSDNTKTWQVTVNRDGQTRTMTIKHLIFATGFGGGYPKMPDLPGKELFRGSVLHSTQYNSVEDYKGKKVIVVGAGNSGHDIARDFCYHGWDVTMIQRSPIYVVSREALARRLGDTYNDHFPIEFADILGSALPFATQKYLLTASVTRIANGIDKELLDNLEKAGFQTYLGPDGTGSLPLILGRGGGICVDVGSSRDIISGAIKMKSTPGIRRFVEEGVVLEDETVLQGDVVIFATGFGDFRDSIGEVCGADVAEKVGKVWGLDAEGELQGVCRPTGHQRLWVTMGNVSRCRLASLNLALQIKAIEEGIIDDETTQLDKWSLVNGNFGAQ